MLLFVKMILRRFFLLQEFCKSCGCTVEAAFHVRDEVWKKVVGDPGTVRCIRCFDKEAQTKGIFLRWSERDL